MNSNTFLPIIIVLVVVLIVAFIAWFTMRKNRSDKLRQKFGLEYDYTVKKEGDTRKAEQFLEAREKKVSELDIHPLDPALRDQYNTEWVEIKSQFVDDPSGAIEKANRLITEVMIARGFPVEDFEERAADLSVLYPGFVPSYRDAYKIALNNQKNGTSTEDLRKAMLNYRSLFDALLETEQTKEMETIK